MLMSEGKIVSGATYLITSSVTDDVELVRRKAARTPLLLVVDGIVAAFTVAEGLCAL